MIPKKIHYCWFGGVPIPKEFEENIKTWRVYCPDYQLVCWNESNFDIESVEYVKRAYQMKKFAFVSDYVRLHVLYHQGGIYLDTDVEILKPLDAFLSHRCFMGRDRQSKSEEAAEIGTGLIGAEKNYPWLQELLSFYLTEQVLAPHGKIYQKTINWIMTADAFSRKKLRIANEIQELEEGLTIYPTTYFSPMDYATRRVYKTENTYAIHKYAGSWTNKNKRNRSKIQKLFRTICGEKKYWKIKDRIAKARGKKIISK